MNYLKPTLLAFILALVCGTSFAQRTYVPRNDYHIGADLSFLKQAEDMGVQFKENGTVKPGMDIFTDHGYNWIRLRLFHTPSAWTGQWGTLPNDLEYTIAMAKEAKSKGMKFLLNYHYSDTWADPGKQYIPKAWEGMSHEELVQAVFDYTLETMNAFRDAGVYPDMVQVGNEITNGMLWPDGKLPENWSNFIDLVRAGINGVYASCTARLPAPKIMIHIEKGGDKNATKYFFDKIFAAGLPFDVIGQSYYPWWHGSLLDLRENMHFMATNYKKDIILVEAAYNMETAEYKDKSGPFPETPQGQLEFMQAVHEIILSTPDNRGMGIYWWEPATRRNGARTYFDREGNVQPVITAFDKYTRN
ncbi:MAG: arabinogalactan endo-1,4-beta-galactosidase [Rikenellaceae bacterium]|nr:arabinogalactan endo-1,4-beta-galactosidase [Rikenellaceae bacterium]